MQKENKKDTKINEAMASLNKKYGANAIAQIDKIGRIDIEAISTNCYSLDHVFGCGGLPRGRIIEIFGEQSSGKSTLATYIIAQVQKRGGKAVYIDVEYSFSTDYAEKIGVDVDKLVLAQPTTGEEALDMIDIMARTNKIDIIVLDSVAALVPKKELEGEIGDVSIALQARMMSKALRMITRSVSYSKTAVIFINQTRDKVGVFWGKKTTTSGGKALNFYASVRLEVKKGKNIVDKNDNVIGNFMGICAVKNKVASPFRKCEIELIYKKGVDVAGDVLDASVKNGIVDRAGASYSFKKDKLAVGRDKTKEYLIQNPKIFENIKKELICYEKEQN